jgi:hypothetical protein
MAAWGPDGLEERATLSDEIIGLARETGNQELELIGRARRITCSMESAARQAVDADLALLERLAADLRMPYHEWVAATVRAGLAVLDDRFTTVEELAAAALALLPARQNAVGAHLNQMTAIRWDQGRIGEQHRDLLETVRQFPQAGFGRGWLAVAEAELGQEDEARRSLGALVDAFAGLPRDGIWLPTLALAALACAGLGDDDAMALLYSRLRPYEARTVVVPMPHPVVSFGSASLYLALLASGLSRWDAADAHFQEAIRANTRLGATALLARTQYEYARMLIARGQSTDRQRALTLLERAESTAHHIGMSWLGARVARLKALEAGAALPLGEATAAVVASIGASNVFSREGDYWTVVHEGSLARLRDSKGLRYLARLLAAPGREFHVIDLQGADSPAATGRALPRQLWELEVRPNLGDAGELLDATAKAAYKARLDELRADVDEAERVSDLDRAARAREEIEFIADELARAIGLAGRDRRAASHSERARLNVTRAIHAAMVNLARVHPALGQHLSATMRTGNYCSYTPDPRVEVSWDTGPPRAAGV